MLNLSFDIFATFPKTDYNHQNNKNLKHLHAQYCFESLKLAHVLADKK